MKEPKTTFFITVMTTLCWVLTVIVPFSAMEYRPTVNYIDGWIGGALFCGFSCFLTVLTGLKWLEK